MDHIDGLSGKEEYLALKMLNKEKENDFCTIALACILFTVCFYLLTEHLF